MCRASVLRLYVGGIGRDATELDLYAAFAAVGVPLALVELVVNRATGFLRGFAFVAVDERARIGAGANLDGVLARMRMAEVGGRQVVVQPIAGDLGSRPGPWCDSG